MPPDLEAVVFDHDGVLVDSVRGDLLACSALFRDFGARLPGDLWATEVCGRPDGYPGLFRTLRAASGTDADDADLWRRLEAHWERYLTARHVVLRPGVRELLGALRTAGYPLAVASAADADWVGRWLGHYDLAGSFDVVVTGEQVARRKPDPAVYLEAASRLGVPPERCVVFEDSVTGVAAARAAGMTVLAVPTEATRVCDYSAAHHVLPDLRAVEPSWFPPARPTTRRAVASRRRPAATDRSL
ncbi:HAD family phosphatase [Streptomyces durbertensis]|uniref:HAD family phosphatase n=1 Tax=Streptomyces durbertensis TaxID=2448886 RepID=A0ABR6EBA8_9ACTN|nr:HAD family phosphatase [Streptomyces durbertensis]